MTDCTHLSDRMPDVALGRSRWTAAEERHLSVCADCRAEWTIVSAARRLGSALPAPSDPVVTAARVLGRIADERTRGRTRARAWIAAGLAAAAALAVVVGSRQSRGTAPAAGSTPDVPAPVATRPAPSGPAPVGAGMAPGVRAPVASGPSSAASTELPLVVLHLPPPPREGTGRGAKPVHLVPREAELLLDPLGVPLPDAAAQLLEPWTPRHGLRCRLLRADRSDRGKGHEGERPDRPSHQPSNPASARSSSWSPAWSVGLS